MIESKDIKKMVQHIIKRDNGVADTHIMHPTREWFIGIGISFMIVALGSWFCFYLYTFYTNEMKKEVVIIEQVVPYQAAAVESALALFTIKQTMYNEIIGENVAPRILPISIATTTPKQAAATSTENTPKLMTDPEPIFEDGGEPINAELAP